MPLSIAQIEQLSKLIKNKRPPWEVSMFLMKDCGLKFKEASDVRRWAIETYRKPYTNERTETKSETQPPQTEEKANPEVEDGSFRLIQETYQPDDFGSGSEESGADRSLEEIVYGQPPKNPDDYCITCDAPLTDNCSCVVRTVSDIPF